jgi:hypothetical protein
MEFMVIGLNNADFDVDFHPLILALLRTPWDINFTLVLFMLVYVIINLYHQPDREYEQKIYTENFDAYWTNLKRHQKGEKLSENIFYKIKTLFNWFRGDTRS